MRGYDSESSGFSLVEVIIAMFLLGIIAMALLPALWQGIVLSSQQSSTATATRFLNEVVEAARQSADCGQLESFETTPRTTTDGRGVSMTTAGTTVSDCGVGGAPTTLAIRIESSGRVLASTTALIYIP